MKKMLFLLWLISLGPLMAAAQPMENPVHWAYSAEKTGDGEVELVFTATIEPGWYLYSQFIGDEGPVPTSIVFYEADGFTPRGETSEQGEKVEGMDKLFGMHITKFRDQAVFRQRAGIAAGAKAISGYIEYMSCDEEKCLPPRRDEFAIELR